MAVAWISNSPILYVQGGTTATTTFAASPPAGSTVFLTLGAYEPAGVDPVVTDNQGNTWTRLYLTGSLGNNSAVLYACWSIAGGASLTIRVTGADGSYITGAAAAFTPLVNPANASGVVASDTSATSGQSVSTSAATTQADAVSISVMAQSGSIVLSNYTCAGFTSIFYQPSPNVFQPGGAAYRIETTTGTKTAAWSWDSAPGTQANSIIAVFQGVSSGTDVTPGVGSIALSGPAPTVTRTANQVLAPTTGAIALTGSAPTVVQSAVRQAFPTTGTIGMAGYAPTVSQSDVRQAFPTTGTIALTGYAPSVTQSTIGTNVTPATGTIALTGYAPTVGQTANQFLTPTTGALAMSGPIPVVFQSDVRQAFPTTGVLGLAGYAPTVAQSAVQGAAPGTGVLTLSGPAPVVSQTAVRQVNPATGLLALTGYAPSVVQTTGFTLLPDTGTLALAGYAPSVTQTGLRVTNPAPGLLALSGPAPTVRQGPPAGQGSSAVRRYQLQAYQDYFDYKERQKAPLKKQVEPTPVRVPKKLARTALVEPVPLREPDVAVAAEIALRLLHSQDAFKTRLARIERVTMRPLHTSISSSATPEQAEEDEDEMLLLAAIL